MNKDGLLKIIINDEIIKDPKLKQKLINFLKENGDLIEERKARYFLNKKAKDFILEHYKEINYREEIFNKIKNFKEED